MNTKDATILLKSTGWLVYKDEVGDRYTHFKLPDRTIQIVYGLRKWPDYQEFSSTLSLSSDAFSSACRHIQNDNSTYTPLVRARKGLLFRAPEITKEHIQQAAQEAIEWAKEQDLYQALLNYAALPTDAPGARPIWHLAALALLANIAKLESYQSSFEAGDRLGFVPYISKDYIDRAVAIARQNAAL